MPNVEDLHTQDTLPMLRRIAVWGSLYQMAGTEAFAEFLNISLADSRYHLVAAVIAIAGVVPGIPFIYSLIMPKRFEHTLEIIDEEMRFRAGLRRYIPPQDDLLPK